MTRDDVLRLVQLAHRLGTTPRRILAAAARRVDDEHVDVGLAMRAPPGAPATARTATDTCADLLLTPVGNYSRVDVESAIQVLWRDDIRSR
ncbi:hypothetical protein ACQQ2N_02345 [Dokdonella sp. MW10]|uniref:hypothetical protein n=1 Tax=Dokdonella sp. MW10 TaxID=2992926 RepID=UPI003F7F8017